MKTIFAVCLVLGLFASAVSTALGQSPENSGGDAAWTVRLDQIRQIGGMIPGRRALRINVLKFAESHRSKKFSVQGAPDERSIQARTVFQIVFADGTVMIDSGMDEQVHRFFGRGAVEPFDAEAAKQVEQALRKAR